MNIQQIKEALTIQDTSLRCQRVLDEVQPVLRKVMEDFKSKYKLDEPKLLDYSVNTYEVTLRTTMHDARNPKYADQKRDTEIGKKAWIELADKSYACQTELWVLNVGFYGPEGKCKIVLPTNFYPLWEAVRTKGNENEFRKVLALLPDEVEIQTSDPGVSLNKDELVPYLQKCIEEKRKPWFYFGKFVELDHLTSTEQLVDLMWLTWNLSKPMRELLEQETAKHALSLTMLQALNEHQDKMQLKLCGKMYEIQFEEVFKNKPYQRRQKFGIYEKGQLITDGALLSLHREPNEAYGIFVNGNGFTFSNLRALHGDGRVEWRLTKSFKHHKKDDGDVNKATQAKAMEALAAHGFELDNNTYTAGTWDNENLQFVEGVSEVKRRLTTAAVLFADSTGLITLPRDSTSPDTAVTDDDEHEEMSIEELFEHDFNLSSIMSNIRDSGLTYTDAMIRDFHLNLVCLEDKHFVILNGISGTGKTRLCLLYANAVYGKSLDTSNPYLKVIPVRPDWTDSTSLFGYYSALEKRYVRTPFLNAVLDAIHKGKPMFIVLDEMNLARVEYYLSDYLSAVESRQPIRLHSEEHISDVPQELQIPHNLYVIGTINVDETTHSISDKVLDRAFVMTLSDVDMDPFWERIGEKLQTALQEEWELIKQLQSMLCKYDLHFGYRTMNEMLRKLYANYQLPDELRLDGLEAVDQVITEKVLPKVRGDERVEALLVQLIEWTNNTFGGGSTTRTHLMRMKGELERYGATQFWR
jgi:5-methylcytosine-specific restriction protein B